MGDAIRASQWGDALELQVEGRGTMQQCPGLRRWVEARLARGARSIRVDLSRCSHLDSTFVGTLLVLNRRLVAAGGGPIVLSVPSAASAKVLAQMHVQEQFLLSTEPPGPRQWQEELPVEANVATSYGFKQNVVEAHQELGRMEGPNAAQFRELAEQMAAELPPPKRPGSLHDTIVAE
jgi:anti-anti-sigma regulatory factor